MNSNMMIIIAIAVFILLLGAIAFIWKKNKCNNTDYYTFFTLGIVWTIMGISSKIYSLSIIGIVFLIIGLLNKDKWKERKTWNKLSKEEKRLKIIMIIVLTIAFVTGITVYFLI